MRFLRFVCIISVRDRQCWNARQIAPQPRPSTTLHNPTICQMSMSLQNIYAQSGKRMCNVCSCVRVSVCVFVYVVSSPKYVFWVSLQGQIAMSICKSPVGLGIGKWATERVRSSHRACDMGWGRKCEILSDEKGFSAEPIQLMGKLNSFTWWWNWFWWCATNVYLFYV